MFREYLRGGVVLPQRTQLTSNVPFQNIAVPHLCRFPLLQHTGKAAIPCVKPGDNVTEGQVIGLADGDASANIHTSIPGRICSISAIATIWGSEQSAITIEASGSFPFFNNSPETEWRTLQPKDIGRLIRDAGIVRMGGSPVPEHLRLPGESDPVPEALIINCIESEPYLTSASTMLSAHTNALVEGALIIQRMTGAVHTVIAVDASTPKKILDALSSIIRQNADPHAVSVRKIPQIYPLGADTILADIIAKKKIPLGQQPKKHGVLIETAATVFAIYEAVAGKKPLYEKFITVSGRGIKKPGNYKVRLGTPVSHIIEECGGFTCAKPVVLASGPMRGLRVENLDAPVDKKVTALLFLTKSEIAGSHSFPCIRCGNCIDHCPMKLNPRALAQNKKPEQGYASSCIRCSVCSFVCPAGIDLSTIIADRRVQVRNTAQ